MILVRTILHAKFGKGGELAKIMANSAGGTASATQMKGRVLSDLSGEFDTVVIEGVHESLAAWEEFRAKLFTTPEFQEGMSTGQDMILSGRQEFFTIEAEF